MAQTLPPVVNVTSPMIGAVSFIGNTINLAAEATDPDGAVSRLELYVDSELLVAGTNSQLMLSWSTTNQGSHVVQARATDNSGVATESEPVWFGVRRPGPANDRFADRTPFTGNFVTVTGTTVNATIEPGETNLVYYRSVWWAWTAPESGDFTITIASNNGQQPAMAVFTGSTLASLSLMTNNASVSVDLGHVLGYSTRVTLRTQAGTTYPIAVGGAGPSGPVRLSVIRALPPSVAMITPADGAVFIAGQTVSLVADASDPDGTVRRVEFYQDGHKFLGAVTNRPFVLNFPTIEGEREYWIGAVATDDHGLTTTVSRGVQFFVQSPPPPNDNFAARTPLAGVLVVTEADTRRATHEPEEPTPTPFPGLGSVWWSWTAPASGQATLNVSDTPVFLGVYTGDSLTNLILAATNALMDSAQLTFEAVAGTEYQIAVVSSYGSERLLLSLFLDERELRGPRLLRDGVFSFDLRTTVERVWTIEASTNLVNWEPLATGRLGEGAFEFQDPTAAAHPRRFYRAVALPQ